MIRLWLGPPARWPENKEEEFRLRGIRADILRAGPQLGRCPVEKRFPLESLIHTPIRHFSERV